MADGLEHFENVKLVPTEWADGDSFLARFPDGEERTLRLYGADCIEWHIGDETDARRLRAQRRYFGITGVGGSPSASIELATGLGEKAASATRELLAKPFAVHTAFADARGDGRYKRYYAFVTTSAGKDLAQELVARGLARAFGVYRAAPGGISHKEYEARLQDAELVAAREGVGVWQYTDWASLPRERGEQRSEEGELAIAMGTAPPDSPLDPNTAARDELMRIPGIGESTANAIIEARPFASREDLLRVRGIGPATLEKISPFLTLKE
jgi:competence protein ComEA